MCHLALRCQAATFTGQELHHAPQSDGFRPVQHDEVRPRRFGQRRVVMCVKLGINDLVIMRPPGRVVEIEVVAATHLTASDIGLYDDPRPFSAG